MAMQMRSLFCLGLVAVLLYLGLAWAQGHAQTSPCADTLAQTQSMVEVLRASRDQAEATVAQLHARLRQALQEIETLKREMEDKKDASKPQKAE